VIKNRFFNIGCLTDMDIGFILAKMGYKQFVVWFAQRIDFGHNAHVKRWEKWDWITLVKGVPSKSFLSS